MITVRVLTHKLAFKSALERDLLYIFLLCLQQFQFIPASSQINDYYYY
jgi:hypothetical protein